MKTHKVKHPTFLRSLFNLTADDSKIPTNQQLDSDIEYLGTLMQVVWPLLKIIIKKKIGLFFKYKWKRPVKYIIYFVMLITAVLIPYTQFVEPQIRREVKTVTEEIYVSNLKSYDEFIQAVLMKESGGNWKEHSSLMLGGFQFHPNTLKAIGFNIEPEYFLQDSSLQIAAFKRSIYISQQRYQSYITKWNGKSLPQDSRYIMTESGIIMAFHLKPAAAIEYFNSGCKNDNVDGNGVSISSYIKKFSGYKID